MFEQSMLSERALTHKPWTMAVSLTGQTMLVGLAMLLPLVFTDTLQRVQYYVGISPPPSWSPPRPPDVVKTVAATVQRQIIGGRIFTPTSVPAQAKIVVDDIAAPEISGTGQPGVFGGIGAPGSGAAGIMTSLIQIPQVTPPPAAPVVQAAPKPAPIPRITVGGNVQAAKLIDSPPPMYPPLARQARISGTVLIGALIAPDGTIAGLRVRSGHPLLVPAAVEAVKHWRYKPTLLNGDPVEVATEISVIFTLR